MRVLQNFDRYISWLPGRDKLCLLVKADVSKILRPEIVLHNQAELDRTKSHRKQLLTLLSYLVTLENFLSRVILEIEFRAVARSENPEGACSTEWG